MLMYKDRDGIIYPENIVNHIEIGDHTDPQFDKFTHIYIDGFGGEKTVVPVNITEELTEEYEPTYIDSSGKTYSKAVFNSDAQSFMVGQIHVKPIESDIGVGSEESKRGEGMRYNKQKTPYECIPLHLISGAARIFKQVTERPEKPYPMWNWANGMKWSVPYSCMLRHLDAWYRGKDNDSETEENHLHHVLCNLLMLIHYIDAFEEGDDRPKEFFKPGGMDT